MVSGIVVVVEVDVLEVEVVGGSVVGGEVVVVDSAVVDVSATVVVDSLASSGLHAARPKPRTSAKVRARCIDDKLIGLSTCPHEPLEVCPDTTEQPR